MPVGVFDALGVVVAVALGVCVLVGVAVSVAVSVAVRVGVDVSDAVGVVVGVSLEAEVGPAVGKMSCTITAPVTPRAPSSTYGYVPDCRTSRGSEMSPG
jgi:hypothetical protein